MSGAARAVLPKPGDGKVLADLASRVVRLSPDRHDPEKYHLEKSEIVADLRRLARAMGAGR